MNEHIILKLIRFQIYFTFLAGAIFLLSGRIGVIYEVGEISIVGILLINQSILVFLAYDRFKEVLQ